MYNLFCFYCFVLLYLIILNQNDMKHIILKHYPGLDADEIEEVIAEYESDTITAVCSNCRVELTDDDLHSRVINWGDWENPAEFEYSCPNCYEVEPEMVKPTLDEWLIIENGGAI